MKSAHFPFIWCMWCPIYVDAIIKRLSMYCCFNVVLILYQNKIKAVELLLWNEIPIPTNVFWLSTRVSSTNLIMILLTNLNKNYNELLENWNQNYRQTFIRTFTYLFHVLENFMELVKFIKCHQMIEYSIYLSDI